MRVIAEKKKQENRKRATNSRNSINCKANFKYVCSSAPLFFLVFFIIFCVGAAAALHFNLSWTFDDFSLTPFWQWLSSTSAGKLFVLFLHFCLINFTKQRAVVRVYDTLARDFMLTTLTKCQCFWAGRGKLVFWRMLRIISLKLLTVVFRDGGTFAWIN